MGPRVNRRHVDAFTPGNHSIFSRIHRHRQEARVVNGRLQRHSTSIVGAPSMQLRTLSALRSCQQLNRATQQR